MWYDPKFDRRGEWKRLYTNSYKRLKEIQKEIVNNG